MDQIKRMWGHYLALIIILTILVFPMYWIYKTVQHRLGNDAASLALAITVVLMLMLGVQGGVHAHRINRVLREEAASKSQPDGNAKPVVLEVLGVELLQYQHPAPDPGAQPENTEQETPEFSSLPRKRRGKQPRFPEDKIRKAVLKWERRDPSFSARTLEEFLEQEFGCGPDGILLMATSTFYDWRRHVLKEIESQQHNH